jgi:hypothetical protein
MARMARGLSPDVGISRWRVIAHALTGYFYNPFRTTKPRALLGAAPVRATETKTKSIEDIAA